MEKHTEQQISATSNAKRHAAWQVTACAEPVSCEAPPDAGGRPCYSASHGMDGRGRRRRVVRTRRWTDGECAAEGSSPETLLLGASPETAASGRPYHSAAHGSGWWELLLLGIRLLRRLCEGSSPRRLCCSSFTFRRPAIGTHEFVLLNGSLPLYCRVVCVAFPDV